MVLLFNSKLKLFAGKLKSKWSGHFEVVKVFPYGVLELKDIRNGTTFKVNGHRVKLYFGNNLSKRVLQLFKSKRCRDGRASNLKTKR